jgi:2-oxoisovalerate dehydrogenase E1 component
MESQNILSVESLLDMFRRMVLIRRFEDYLYQMFLQGLLPGTLHQYQGQEAVAVGVCSALRTDDVTFGTHRSVGHVIARGSSVRGLAAEMWGKATGCVGGKGGQMHLAGVSIGAMPSNAIVGANIPIATGAALGFKLRGMDRVAVSFFGDGASNTGAFHEGVNLAAVKDAPVVFVCENNLYAASTHISMAMRISDIAERAKAYGIPGLIVDGMDVLAVYQAATEAVARARQGEGPTLLECKTYRYSGHSRSDAGGYRSKEEFQHWRERDAILRLRKLLVTDYEQNEQELDRIERECQAEVEEAVAFARSSPDPAPEACFEHVYAKVFGKSDTRPHLTPPPPAPLPSPQAEVASKAKQSGEGPGVSSRMMTMAEALRDAMRLAMRHDPSVFLLGEDIGVTGGFGGGFTVTLGLSDEFGHERVMDTPISEIAIIGASVGAAMVGMRPVADMQYGDFVLCGMDQVVNQAAKMHYMSNGQVSVPMVLRLPVGANTRGAQHGQCSDAWFMHTPGLKVVCPSNPYDAKGLLLAAIWDNNPVIFLEHKQLYGAKGRREVGMSTGLIAEVPEYEYEIPLGTVAVKRAGTDITILANMLMVHRALVAADELAQKGISAEIIDVRCLVPLDMDTLAESAKKTTRVLIVEEDNLTGGWGAEVAARLGEVAFYHLNAPIARVAAPDTPPPCSPALERVYVPGIERIVQEAQRLVRE